MTSGLVIYRNVRCVLSKIQKNFTYVVSLHITAIINHLALIPLKFIDFHVEVTQDENAPVTIK